MFSFFIHEATSTQGVPMPLGGPRALRAPWGAKGPFEPPPPSSESGSSSSVHRVGDLSTSSNDYDAIPRTNSVLTFGCHGLFLVGFWVSWFIPCWILNLMVHSVLDLGFHGLFLIGFWVSCFIPGGVGVSWFIPCWILGFMV